MERGEIKYKDHPRNVLTEISRQQGSSYSHYLPDIPELFFELGWDSENNQEIPLTVKEGKEWINRKAIIRTEVKKGILK